MICPQCQSEIELSQGGNRLCPRCDYYFKHEDGYYKGTGAATKRGPSLHDHRTAVSQPAIIGVLFMLGWVDIVLTGGWIIYSMNQLSTLSAGYDVPLEAYGLLAWFAVAGLTSGAILFGFAALLSLVVSIKATLIR